MGSFLDGWRRRASYSQEGRGKDVVALFHKQNLPLNFTKLPVSYSSEYGSIMMHLLIRLVRQDGSGCVGASRNY